MNESLGFAIIGTGTIAEFHARALQQVRHAHLVTAFSRNPEKSDAFAARHNVKPSHSLREVLKNKAVDVVCVTTTSGSHAEVAIPALRRGKHVLCEKPLDIRLGRIDAMLKAAQKQQRHLGGIFQSRFGSGARTLKDAINQGRFGQLTLCDAYIKWWRTQDYYNSGVWRGTWELDGGGALMNQGIHGVDLLQWLVGMPAEVHACAATLAHTKIEVEDTVAAVLKYPHGALGVIEAATSVWPGFARRIEISGQRGSAVLEDDRLITWKFETELPGDQAIREQAAQPSVLGGGAADPKAISAEGHRLQMQDFVDAIRENRAPAIPGAEGRKAVELVLAIYKSAKTGRKVALTPS